MGRERFLILGVGVLEGTKLRPFRAILAHEYGRFSNCDTAGGGLALADRWAARSGGTSPTMAALMANSLLRPRGLFFAFLVSALLTLLAQSGWLVKPLTLALLLGAVLVEAQRGRARYSWAIACGLALSLAGDVFLMVPGDFFLQGLLCFLVAHLAYLFAFTDGCRFFPRRLPALALLAVDRFRAPFAGARAAVLVTYFAAQWLIARSALAPQE